LWPYPVAGTYEVGGHAVDVVGYNDGVRCPNTLASGAFLCRNSWSANWGMAGYFWLPYEFVTRAYGGRRLAQDFWALGKIEWLNV
jgi:C1A family cysteine protease